MPSQKSSRSAERKQTQNRPLRSAARTGVAAARQVIEAGDPQAAEAAVHRAQTILDKTAQKGALHPNNVARRKGRLARQLNKSQQQG